MHEISIVFEITFKMFFVTIGAMLYSLSGRDDIFWWTKKFMRRFIAPAVVLGCTHVAWNLDNISHLWYLYIICYAIMCTSLSMGYGADTTIRKLAKRAKVALIFSLSYWVLAFNSGSWGLAIIASLCSVTMSVVFGTYNPVNASEEELYIGLVLFLFIPLL